MNKVMIFSGTTEGRQLSEILCRDKVKHIVCVATQYGKTLMSENEYADVRTGRMDAAQMCDFLAKEGYDKGDVLVDATHPYAAEATGNIRTAAEGAGCEYIRVIREQGSSPEEEPGLHRYSSLKECLEFLNTLVPSSSDNKNPVRNDTGNVINILLTTGAKELHEYSEGIDASLLDSTYVRVLPSAESLEICENAGIPLSNIIAMQGPFSYEINRALMHQYNIKHLVTKDSGRNGGYEEKLAAARELGVTVHIIERPVKEEGLSVGEAYERICLLTADDESGYKTTGGSGCAVPDRENLAKDRGHLHRTIFLCGCGTGSESQMTDAVKKAVSNSDAVFGSGRMLANPAVAALKNKSYEKYLAGDIIPILESDPDIHTAAILFSGDSGFYSGAKTAVRELKKWDSNAELNILPGISSVSYLAAKLGESYDDACYFSLHGRFNDHSLNELLNKVMHNRKTFVLLSGLADLNALGRALVSRNMDCTIFLGSNLSYDSERIKALTPQEAVVYSQGSGNNMEAEGPAANLLTILITNEKKAPHAVYKAFSDDEFIRADIPMTKETVRHESILRLDLKEGDVVYDIGGGTGSVSIEIAAQDPSLKVYTFEKKAEAAELIRQNIDRFHADNVTLISGEAPEAFADIEAPDKVFIGGSSGLLEDIILKISGKKEGKSRVRYVVNAVTLETINEISGIIEKYEAGDVHAVQLSCSTVEAVGKYHMLRAQNPVMIFSFLI